jgi:hypothetical protein
VQCAYTGYAESPSAAQPLSLTFNVSQSGLLVAFVHADNPPSAPNGFTTIAKASCSSGGSIGLFYKEDCGTGSITVSSVGDVYSLQVREFTGVAMSGAFDGKAATSSGSPTKLPLVGPLDQPTSSPNDLVVAAVACHTGPMSSVSGSGFVGEDHRGFLEYRIGMLEASRKITAANETSETYAMIGAAFKPNTIQGLAQPQPQPRFEFVQSYASGTGWQEKSITVSPTAGNLLVAYVHSQYATGSLIDAGGNTWTYITNASGGDAQYIRMYYATNCSGGSYTVALDG